MVRIESRSQRCQDVDLAASGQPEGFGRDASVESDTGERERVAGARCRAVAGDRAGVVVRARGDRLQIVAVLHHERLVEAEALLDRLGGGGPADVGGGDLVVRCPAGFGNQKKMPKVTSVVSRSMRTAPTRRRTK
ncbi:hypothetical protein BKA00_005280 [Actinomadura coerulea]|uniref:Uncharacterized protein n=1 Tax=Actinomadura coerulea TaxID=46159 RepID=A0A7X0G4V6_9ACTN|nr:hypothetical protein [Actinomadura coerulea]MBB6398366.1 hypothetical protein [Actinomadura coerulea]